MGPVQFATRVNRSLCVVVLSDVSVGVVVRPVVVGGVGIRPVAVGDVVVVPVVKVEKLVALSIIAFVVRATEISIAVGLGDSSNTRTPARSAGWC